MPLLHKGRKETKLPLARMYASSGRLKTFASRLLQGAAFSPKPGIRHGSPGEGRWRLAGSYISTSENEKEKWWKENYRTGMFAGLGRNKDTSDLGKKRGWLVRVAPLTGAVSFKAGPGYGGLLTRTRITGRKLLEGTFT